jgi:hypothetical protein
MGRIRSAHSIGTIFFASSRFWKRLTGQTRKDNMRFLYLHREFFWGMFAGSMSEWLVIYAPRWLWDRWLWLRWFSH